MIGYWAAQEQYSMQDLLAFVTKAEQAGFQSTMTSDHFHPWWHDDAYGNFTWLWMAAAAERTKKMRFATGITSPVFRYHPAIIAQAFASFDVLYPGRVALGVGSGEAMNESPLGFEWPGAGERLDRTDEAIRIIKQLWTGEFVDFDGEHYKIKTAKLYTPPSHHIPLYMASSGKRSARIAGEHCDGLITFVKPSQVQEIFQSFDAAAKEAGRDPSGLEKIAEYKVSFSEDYDAAFESTKFWRATEIEGVFNSPISDPRELERKALAEVPDEKLKESIQIATSIDECIKPIERYFKAGFTKVYVHSTSPDEFKFIEAFSKHAMPHLGRATAA